jgi:hypothetical protein
VKVEQHGGKRCRKRREPAFARFDLLGLLTARIHCPSNLDAFLKEIHKLPFQRQDFSAARSSRERELESRRKVRLIFPGKLQKHLCFVVGPCIACPFLIGAAISASLDNFGQGRHGIALKVSVTDCHVKHSTKCRQTPDGERRAALSHRMGGEIDEVSMSERACIAASEEVD